ncbi:MAG: SprT family zinc-dependent metalloprotease [Pseudomonadota bacterium]
MGFFRRTAPPVDRASAITSFHLDGEHLPVLVRENDRAKRFTLRLDKTGAGLTITVPSGARRGPVETFLSRHAGWIATQRVKRPPALTPADGALIPIRGVPHRIRHQIGRGTTHVRQDAGHVRQDAGAEMRLHVFGDAAHLGRRVGDYLKRQAKLDLERLSLSHAASLGVKPNRIVMRDTSSRWGSCSSTGTLSYSWRIVIAPPEIIDYLAAHEVAHLREMNHGPGFWALVERVCPDYNAHRQWLKQHGKSLHAWQF